jgi:hypothetical protein
VNWGSSCPFLDALGDEFVNADAAGGTITFDGHAEAFAASGICAVTVTTSNPDDAVWSACTGTGTGFTKASDDNNNDRSEFRLTSDPASTTEHVAFVSSGQFVVTAVTIKHR